LLGAAFSLAQMMRNPLWLLGALLLFSLQGAVSASAAGFFLGCARRSPEAPDGGPRILLQPITGPVTLVLLTLRLLGWMALGATCGLVVAALWFVVDLIWPHGHLPDAVESSGPVLLALGAAGGAIWGSLRYSQAFWLRAERPDLRPSDAVSLGSEMMNGHRLRYLKLAVLLALPWGGVAAPSWLGWAAWAALALFWAPYDAVCTALFYLSLPGREALALLPRAEMREVVARIAASRSDGASGAAARPTESGGSSGRD